MAALKHMRKEKKKTAAIQSCKPHVESNDWYGDTESLFYTTDVINKWLKCAINEMNQSDCNGRYRQKMWCVFFCFIDSGMSFDCLRMHHFGFINQ